MLRVFPEYNAGIEFQADRSLREFGLTEMTREADRANGPTNKLRANVQRTSCACVSLESSVGGEVAGIVR